MRPEHHHARPEVPHVGRWAAPDDMASETETSAFLGSLVRFLKPNLVVETGTYQGHTTRSIAEALRENGQGVVVGLEIDEDAVLKARARVVGLPAEIVQTDALTWTPDRAIDLLFLDTELHLRPAEIRRFSQHASLGCTLVVHDTQDLGLRAALDQLTAEGITTPWVYFPTPRGLGIARYTGKVTETLGEIPLSVSPGSVAYLGRWNLPFFFAGQIVGLDTPVGSAKMAIEGADVAQSRNKAVARMLGFPAHRWLLFVDDDMLFEDDALARLLVHDKPVVSGLAFARRAPYTPCVYPITEEQMASGGLVEIEEAGTGFLLIRRDVLEALSRPWFEAGQIESGEMREDKHFCQKVRAAGFPIFVDTSLKIGHQIDAWVRSGPDGKPQIITM